MILKVLRSRSHLFDSGQEVRVYKNLMYVFDPNFLLRTNLFRLVVVYLRR